MPAALGLETTVAASGRARADAKGDARRVRTARQAARLQRCPTMYEAALVPGVSAIVLAAARRACCGS